MSENEKEEAALDLAEKGRAGQRMDRRLFMQLLAFTGSSQSGALAEALAGAEGFDAVLYEDLHDPQGVALLSISEDPEVFLKKVRPMLQSKPFAGLQQKPELTMFGRTYALGYEEDLADTLFARPRRTALNPHWPWAVWYPLRRGGEFEQLEEQRQREILKEHGRIGFAFGRGDYAHDIRLACHGLDTNDNDFVLGLMGKELHPLSALVQSMRKTTQTSLYLQRLGPFFVGKAIWQSALSG